MAIAKHQHIVYKVQQSDIDGYYDDSIDESDTDNKWLAAAALLLGFSVVILKDSGGVTDTVFNNIMSMDVTQLEIPESDLSYYQNLQQELIQHSRIEDPKTIENKGMQWAETQTDQMGMFGDIEAYKAGTLDSYAAAAACGADILIPWNPTGPNTCGECLDMVIDGPYKPDDFPEPVHYGDQCNDPMADPIITFGMGLGTNIIGEIL
jgi:hypothetical protein